MNGNVLRVTWDWLPSLGRGPGRSVHVLPGPWCFLRPSLAHGLAVFGLYVCLAFHLLQEILGFPGLAIASRGVCPGRCGWVSTALG